MRINITKLALIGLVGFFSPGLFFKLCFDKYCEQQADKSKKKAKHK